MCGIVAVVRRRSERLPPDLAALARDLDAAAALLQDAPADLAVAGERLSGAADLLNAVDAALRGVPAVQALVSDPVALAGLELRAGRLAEAVAATEAAIDHLFERGAAHEVERLNAALVRVKDAHWAIAHDRLRTARAVDALTAGDHGLAAVETFTSIQLAFSALDRLEVRGRDSAGLHVLVHGHGLDLADPAIAHMVRERSADPLFATGSVRAPDGHLSFVYKTAAEIGELGDNTAALRGQVHGDELLHLALRNPEARGLVLAHTRWASVGIISEANAHPLNHEEANSDSGPYVVAALNGDVDNYADLAAFEALAIPTEITTDAKVIPALVSRRLAAGVDLDEAFRQTVASFEGSVAIALNAVDQPDDVLLALRGSGQALYVGLADDAFMVASEPYGLVEVADRYLRLDGETERVAGDAASQGQIVRLHGALAGKPEGVRRSSYDGTELALGEDDWKQAEVTTRDVDRGDAPHYLLKEISEAPSSFRKTLRGKLIERDGVLDVRLGSDTLPPTVVERLRAGAIHHIVVIGQGTAAVAGQSCAAALRRALGGRPVTVEATAATELSGFGLRPDMTDTLVIAISQSGTTTDTNRTVDVVRRRGGTVLAIVNRRNSDLVDKSDGVLYTSDGRDVEMSVASTKAFYSQIAAGFLLALALAHELGAADDVTSRQALLASLRALPDAMLELLGRRDAIAQVAQRHAPTRRYWAIVGNGANRIAASEVRIKLSELCYKSIACDATEDKKHIDLSAEPLILVCAAGLSGSTADDVGKELAIYRAHKALAIAIANDGEARLSAALETLWVPVVHPDVAFVLSAMAGHLFGYEAALAIDASARPLREARAAIESAVARTREADAVLARLAGELTPLAQRFFESLRAGAYNGSLEADTAVRLAALLRYAVGTVPLDTYQIEFGKVGTPSRVVEDLTAALTAAIEELTRPVDAIKHQAKTVTVGISRSDETLLGVPLVEQVLATGAARDNLSYRALRTLVELDAAVDAVTGFTRYRIEGDLDDGATIHVVDRGGIALGIPSRTEESPRLRGSKHRAAYEREVTVVRGRADGRTMIFVPEVKGNDTIGLALLHVRFHERLPAEVAKRVLAGYRGRYDAIKDQVTETEPTMRDDVLGRIDLVELLTAPVAQLAEHWRS